MIGFHFIPSKKANYHIFHIYFGAGYDDKYNHVNI